MPGLPPSTPTYLGVPWSCGHTRGGGPRMRGRSQVRDTRQARPRWGRPCGATAPAVRCVHSIPSAAGAVLTWAPRSCWGLHGHLGDRGAGTDRLLPARAHMGVWGHPGRGQATAAPALGASVDAAARHRMGAGRRPGHLVRDGYPGIGGNRRAAICETQSRITLFWLTRG